MNLDYYPLEIVAALEVEMNSLPFCIGTCKNVTTSPALGFLRKKKVHIIESCAVNNRSSSSVSFSRREIALGIGFSFSFSFLDPALGEGGAAPPCEFTAAPSGLAFCDKLVGTGPEAVKGQLIKAHYIGRLEDGKVFDSSYSRGKPLAFRVGVGEVIKGWDEGILGGEGIPPMLAGGKRKLRIPPALGYGSRGAGCRGGSCIIPPDSVLFFDVDLVGKA